VVVSKSIVLEAASGSNPIIDGGGGPGQVKVVHLTADRTRIRGFTIQNGGDFCASAGIYVSSDGNLVTDNRVINTHNKPGIAIASEYDQPPRTGNVISNNTIFGNGDGIHVAFSSRNTIKENIIRGNADDGIEMDGASANMIIANTICDNSTGIGIDGGVGQYALAQNNTIAGNTITNHLGNNGIRLTSSTRSNFIYNNYFADNGFNASDHGKNRWNVPMPWAIDELTGADKNIINGELFGGNYWDDYGGNDTDGDGLGDTQLPYTCGGKIQSVGAKPTT